MDNRLKQDLNSRLLEEKKRLESEIQDLRDYAIKATTYLEDETDASDNHIADDASSLVERQTDMTLLSNLERELSDTDDALRRIAEGTYGICEVCGKPIADKRLIARPMATTCIECQSALETRQRREVSAQP